MSDTPGTPLAGVSRTCMSCQTRHPVTSMGQPGPGLWACLDADACAARQDALGPQSESTEAGIELAVSRREAAQGAPRPVLSAGDATDIRPRTGELIGSKGAPA
jgi:hypothetical protein